MLPLASPSVVAFLFISMAGDLETDFNGGRKQTGRHMATTNLPAKPSTDSSLGAAAEAWSEPGQHNLSCHMRSEYVVTGLDELANWARKGSLWPMTFGLA